MTAAAYRAGEPASCGGELASCAEGLSSPGWIALTDFLPADAIGALREEAGALQAGGRFREAGVGRGAGYAVRADVRGDRILWLDKDNATPAQALFWREIERLRLALNRELFLGLVSFEAHFALYPPGARYATHFDRFGSADERVVSCTLYLNDGWTSRDGGVLRLHLDDGAIDVLPRGGTLVLFRSDTVRHEVLPARRPRLSLTGWLKRRPLRSALLSGVLATALLTGASEASAAEEGPTASRETVVLLHGLGRTTRSLRRLESALTRGGYEVLNVKYRAGRSSIDSVADLLDSRLAERRDAPGARVHFVTHSYGGIVLRHYLETRPFPNLGRVVMLGPPNAGSELADLLRRIPVLRSVAGPVRRSLGTGPDGLPARLGPVRYELGIVAGNRSFNPLFSWLIPGPDDGMVSVERAKVAGMTDFLIVQRTHSFIMRSPQVIAQTTTFLRTGRFDHTTHAGPPGHAILPDRGLRHRLSKQEGSMPFTLREEPESGVVIATCTGALGLSDAKEGAATFWRRPEWSGKPVVWDFRSARLDVTASDVRDLAQFILQNQPSSPPARVALVTAADVDFGMARMFEALREDPSTRVRIFREYDEAVSWARSRGTGAA